MANRTFKAPYGANTDSETTYLGNNLYAKRSGAMIILIFRGIHLGAENQDVVITNNLPDKYASSITSANINFPIFHSETQVENPKYILAGNGYINGKTLVFHNRLGIEADIVGSFVYMGN